MLSPSRLPPRLGAPVRVAHFGGQSEPGTILAIHENGRRLEIACESGELIEFVLNRASARFLARSGSTGPRLELLDDSKHR
ncbi:MAG TPA: hypothetical protein VID48_04815 [Solirubrobacteraceae bacterium]|jgi:hypothetical protein